MGQAEKTVGRVAPDWWVIDLGNTRTKVGNFIDGRLDFLRSLPSNDAPRILCIDRLRPAKAVVASVNPNRLETMLDVLDSIGVAVPVVLRSNGAVFDSGLVSTDVQEPQTIGIDRVLGCLGACLTTPSQTVVVVDCGTATTVNIMTADRCFRGGFIAPGRVIMAKALQKGTAALPNIGGNSWEPIAVGKETRSSISAGISASFIGMIKESLALCLAEHQDAKVVLTGGDSDFASRAMPELHRDDGLVLKGLDWYATQVAAMA